MIPHDPIREQSPYDKQVDLSNFNRLVRAVNTLIKLSFSQDFTVSAGPGGVLVGLAAGEGGTLDYSDFAFGFSISGNKVTVNGGTIRIAQNAAVPVPGEPVEITEDKTWIYVEYPLGGAAEIKKSTTEPVSERDCYRTVLYYVTLTGEGDDAVASIEAGNIKHLGDIYYDVPMGGLKYQVPQRDANLEVVWDWTRWS